MEQKKILAVQGGGRANGNTAQLVKHFVRGAEEAGHQVEVISLIKNEVKRVPWLQCLPLRETLHSKGRL